MSQYRYERFAMLAPGASGYTRVELPSTNHRSLPHPSDSAIEPDTRNELIEGQLIQAQPAHPPHAERHSELDYVLRAHVVADYVTASDMLTRTSELWEIAPDASVRRAGADPATERRHLEELAFEIKSTQTELDLSARARQLSDRGVRRVFGIWVSGDRDGFEVSNGPVKEWCPARDRWIELDTGGVIEDPCFARPLEVRALIDAATADDAVVAALDAKNTPALVRRKRESYERGRREGECNGLRQNIRDLCDVLDIEFTREREAYLAELDMTELQTLRVWLKQHREWRV